MSGIVALIDKARRDRVDPNPERGHLGASQIGDRCARKVWYGFRKAYTEKHTGRLLRLFDRGNLEEHRFVEYLRNAGCEVQDFAQRLVWCPEQNDYACEPWDSDKWTACGYVDVSSDPHHIALATARGLGPKQWGFADHEKHFSGSADGKLRGAGLPEGWGLCEFKTHSDKSFKQLVKSGVLSSKLTHYVQTQIYMHYLGLKWALYLAVNKNDDELYAEIVNYREEIALPTIDKALSIITARTAPLRITNDPSWFECKFCAYREICHYNAAPQKNCRSCEYAQPTRDGEWLCNRFANTIPKDFIPLGCDSWSPIK